MDRRVGRQSAKGRGDPGHPAGPDRGRKLDERRQRALTRYYVGGRGGGIGGRRPHHAVRDPRPEGRPVRAGPALAAEEMDRADRGRAEPLVRIAGRSGRRRRRWREAELARDLGYHAGLLSLAALKGADDDAADRPLPGGGRGDPAGRLLPPAGGRRAGRCRTRSGGGSPRSRTSSPSRSPRSTATRRSTSSAPWPRRAATTSPSTPATTTTSCSTCSRPSASRSAARHGRAADRRRAARPLGGLDDAGGGTARRSARPAARARTIPADLLRADVEVTDANAAFFDAANGFAGCIAGIHEVLRRQGLLEGIWCLDPRRELGPGQAEEIDRVYRAYPRLERRRFRRRAPGRVAAVKEEGG